MGIREGIKNKRPFTRGVTNDFLASIVVFLVALPLCMGIAIASGVPPARGLITGIIGGMVVNIFSGSPLQVSGPAAGLAVVVAELIQEYGIEMLGPVLLLAGLMQWLAGAFKLGQIFRAMSPAVIYGMLAGIGVLIFASQFHVAIDDKPHTHGLDNLLAIPASIQKAVFPPTGSNHHIAALIAIATIATIILWDKFKPKFLRLLPGALIGVVLTTAIATSLRLPIQYVNVPGNLLEAVQLPQPAGLFRLLHAPLILEALAIAFIASAESLLSAVAVDRLHSGERTDFDKELSAQGIGNMICGALGALPMTGVIARSSVNVEAGGKTRLSAILHGIWILILVVAAPGLLRMIPTSSLAAILLVTGIKLIEIEHIRKLQFYGKAPLVIFFATFIGIVVTDLLSGVLIGIVLTAMTLLYKMSRLNIHMQRDDNQPRIDIYLEGAATFIRLPKLAAALEQLPPQKELHVHLDKLAYIDHSSMDLISMWTKQQEQMGSTVIMQWDGLEDRFRKPFLPGRRAIAA
ncbi:MAG: Bicarbonate transporter BicA [Chroococcidiopsis sp. SAG 2025]|uniref:SulP family inorganic anion transporter n=1 Tax=Chroococcidiopsis sp. SAG 2025 TaxID=171389 RepID=UPI0029373F1E|nr:SulP family inorganic anion transporter [Chroococcidiopsis sp. SAG 2025]MDV2992048.1 Bicarbonate transporter BicA [Chroococcidiopsis sp. SAG 2025]